MTDAPLSEDNLMALPGTRRKDFAENYTNRVDGKDTSFWPTSLDSKSHHQQYSDFIRSAHYRNEFELMTCTTCHDPHGNDENLNQLLIAAEDNTTCTQCHIEAAPVNFPPVGEHVEAATGVNHGDSLECVTCHMVGTATSGAQYPELVDGTPPPAETFTYFWGDISGHRFGAQPKELACEQPVPFTNQCATCHAGLLPQVCP
jgi:predicted CXXCH cytochrome family protein